MNTPNAAAPSDPFVPLTGGARRWEFGDRRFALGNFPWVMGILNVTPDSFSDGGKYLSTTDAVEQALRLVEQGAEIIDVGGESTRPGAATVGESEELHRVLPVIESIASRSTVLISIDTTKSEVARQALRAGARIVNDVSGLQFDPRMPQICAEFQAGVICMHIQGTPQTMQQNPQYGDAVEEIANWLDDRLQCLERAGIPRERIVLDPGIGFGKTAEHNLEILSHIARFHECGRPVCVGHSRKRFLKRVLGRPVDETLFATVGVSVALALQQTDIIRVHDVAATRDALLACHTVLNWRRSPADGTNSTAPSASP